MTGRKKIYITPPHLNISELKEDMAYYYEDEPDIINIAAISVEPEEGIPCPKCGSYKTCRNGHARARYVHDIPIGTNKIDILFKPARYKCLERWCNEGTFSRTYDFVDSRRTMTNRLIDLIKKQSLTASFTSLADEYGVTITTVENLFDEYCDELESKRGPIVAPQVLGIDEVHIANEMRGVFTDVMYRNLINIIPSRSTFAVKEAIMAMKHYEDIEVVTMDMYLGYRSVVQEILPDATIIIDKYHVVQNIQKAVAEARKKLTSFLKKQVKELPDDMDKYKKLVLLKQMGEHSHLFKYNHKNLEDKKVDATLMAELCSTFPELDQLRNIKVHAEMIYETQDKEEAGERLDEWLSLIPKDDPVYEKMRSVARTTKRDREYILNYFDDGCYTNAPTEALNGVIKNINAMGRGYSFRTLRHKALNYPNSHRKVIVTRSRPDYPDVIDDEEIIVALVEDKRITPQKAMKLLEKNGLSTERYRKLRMERKKEREKEQHRHSAFGFTTPGSFNVPPEPQRRSSWDYIPDVEEEALEVDMEVLMKDIKKLF